MFAFWFIFLFFELNHSQTRYFIDEFTVTAPTGTTVENFPLPFVCILFCCFPMIFYYYYYCVCYTGSMCSLYNRNI